MVKQNKKLNKASLKNTSKIDTDVFAKGMTKDPDAPFTGKDQWTHCRNCINNSDKGDVGALGNEPANLLCSYTNYPIIGTVYLYGDKWILFSTDDSTSEIGIFDDSECSYITLVNDATASGCLNFKRSNLITGASKENFDCTWQVYWDDGLNPTRTLNIQNIPWIQQQITGPDVDGSDCITYENIEPLRINCEALRIAPLRDTPRISLQKSDSGGQLRNGSYQVFIAYSIDDQKIGDWIGISNVQALWAHEELAGSLDIIIDGIDTGFFEEFKVAILSNWQQEQRAKELGTYAIHTKHISIDYINEELPTVPLETLPLATPVYEKSDKMYVVNDYLVRQGPTEKFDFNYQPLANQIETYWMNTRFPADYYAKGGNKPTFMRDEVYSFFIRWIYHDGEKSSSYHIPGRHHSDYTVPPGYDSILDTTPITDPNNLTINSPDAAQEALWQSYNTAALGGWGTIDGGYDPINNPGYFGLFRTNDGGVITQYGTMGYWQSSENYPNDPVRWNANTGDERYDLCNTPIRHHKFPDEQLSADVGDGGGPANVKFLSRSSYANQYINILGVKFGNIHLPRMNPPAPDECETPTQEPEDPQLIPGIVGYEILVGSRDGNKSIIAKGLAKNMRGHRLPPDSAGNESSESFGDIRGVHANYPFNDLNCDPYLHDPWPANSQGIFNWAYKDNERNEHKGVGVVIEGNNAYHRWAYRDMFTFHSPDTSFNRPYLSPFELKSYGVTQGKSIGRHKKSEKHPQQKLLNDLAAIISIIFGAGYAVQKLRGGANVKFDYPQPFANVPAVASTGAPTNATALATQQLGAAITESIHTSSVLLGAPKFGGQAAIGANTALGLAVTPQMWTGYQQGGFATQYNRDKNWFSELPAILQPFYGVTAFMQSTAEGGNHIFELIYNLCSYQDYAFKYNSHGLFWDTIKFKDSESHRTKVTKARYVKNTIQNLTSDVKMNNLFRPSTVAIITEPELLPSSRVLPTDDIEGVNDNSRALIQQCYYPNYLFTKNIAAHYCALKLNFENQYGQLDTIKQIPISNGERGGGIQYVQDQLQIFYEPTYNSAYTDVELGGDTGSYTEVWDNPYAALEGELIDGEPVPAVPATPSQPSTDNIQPQPSRKRAADSLIIPIPPDLDDVDVEFVPGQGGRVDEIIIPDHRTIIMSDTLYGGDCYISRYTEKVTMPIFWDFLTGQPDGFPFDYRLRSNIMFPMYWANFQRFDLTNLSQYITSFAWLNTTPTQFGAMPSGFHHLDRCGGEGTGIGNSWNPNCITPYDSGWVSAVNSAGADGSGIGIGGETSDWEPDYDIDGFGIEGFFGTSDTPQNLEDAPSGSTFDWDATPDDATSGSGAPTDSIDWDYEDGYDNRKKGLFVIKDGYFYTHVNGINDFFVETPMNIALRDYEDAPEKRHYDWLEFTDVNEMFHSNIQAQGNYYKYDQSLQIDKIVTHKISHSAIQPRYYDPYVAETCWTHYPKRLQYSLQAHKEAVKDYWRVYLPNNYKDFKNKVNVIKPVHKSGAVILFPHLSPVMWQGVDTLQTDLGTKITIGDGGLFSQPQQNIVNADLAHEYGSCESSRSVINTPNGLFYISQAQGKIFQMSGKGLVNIADAGMKQWFNEYLPSKLIKQFPELEDCTIWSDNPVVGVGCQSVYDPNYDLVYFMKKDYNCISECIDFIPCEGFFYNQTRCDGVQGGICCPPGYTWSEEQGECYTSWQVEPIQPEEECPVLVDIIIAVDHSSSIASNDNIDAVAAFVEDLGIGIFDTMGASDARIICMKWSEESQTSYDGPFMTSAAVSNWANNDYTTGSWGTTTPPMGFWKALDRVYASGRPGVPKVLILAMDGYSSEFNTCPDPNDNWCAECMNPVGYYTKGWSSGASAAGNTPSMEDIIADNPTEPGSTDFYIGNNAYGIYAENIPQWSVNGFHAWGDDSTFPGPYMKPNFYPWSNWASGGCPQTDNFIAWLTANVFDVNSQYQDPNHSDFDGQLTVWGVWFTPWNQVNDNPAYVLGAGDYGDPYLADTMFWDTTSGVPEYIGSNHPTNGTQTTIGNQNYTTARASSPSHALWGSLVSPGQIQGMVESILDQTCIEYGSAYCPDDCPNPQLITLWGATTCICLEFVEPDDGLDVRIPVDLTDTNYFEDISWTASYDPKAKSWISFHDWHPDLAIPSLRHFLTTKTIASDTGTCPPGTTLNSITGFCESTYLLNYPATVNVTEIQPVYNDNFSSDVETDTVENACPWDIFFSVDASGSTQGGGALIWQAQLEFIDSFVEQIEDAMNAGTIQVGVAFWSSSVGQNPQCPAFIVDNLDLQDDFRIDLTTDPAVVRNFLGVQVGPLLQQAGHSGAAFTDYKACINAAKAGLDRIFDTSICDIATDLDTGLPTVNTSVVSGITYGDNAQGNEWVGSRHQDPNFTRFAILITDANNTGAAIQLQCESQILPLWNGGACLNAFLWNTGSLGLHRVWWDGYGGGSPGPDYRHWLTWYSDWAVDSTAGGGAAIFNNNLATSNPIFDIKTMVVKSGSVPDPVYLDSMFMMAEEFFVGGEWENDPGTQTDSLADGVTAFNVWTGNFEQPATDVLENLQCNYDVSTVVNTDEEDTCICADPSYTPVYWDSSSNTYTEDEGRCDDGMICRKVECLCDDISPIPGAIPVIFGDCPNVYDVGEPDYINPNPPYCQVTDISQVPPSYLGGSIWKHNVRCDLFANYYEQDYPWEIEWVEAIGQQVATVRSIEYQLESYVYNGNLDNNCGDRFHDLDWNFDEAIIHNTEQVSGLLKLNLSPKNNVPLITQYPIIGGNDIEILYSKEEQKYRFNQFWDTTYDRGEFSAAQNTIFITELNGYIRDLNAANINYNKNALQHKKFRHYYNKVILRRTVSNDRKMILKLANTKINYSFR